MGKLPAFWFYPGDWMKDPSLRSVSSGARGLWIDMLSLMFECDRRGHLTVNDKPVSAEMLARMTGNSTDDVSLYLQELEHSGVFSRLADGTIYSRRQVRDEQDRTANRQRVAEYRRCNKNVTVGVMQSSVNANAPPEKDVGFELGPKKGNGAQNCEPTPPDLNPLEYGRKVLEEIGFPCANESLTVVSQAIQAEVKRGKSKAAAYEYVLAGTLDAQQEGLEINRFFFTDAKYRVENRTKKRVSKREQDFAEARLRSREAD